MKHQTGKVLILGMGNEILTDDGIGIKLTWEIQKQIIHPDVEFDSLSIGGLEIIEFLSPYDTVIILDAIKTLNGIPGSVYRFIPDDFKSTLHIDNLHDISFLNALKVGEKLGIKTPSNIQIIAIEIVEDLVFGDEFSPQVQERWEDINVEVKEIILSILSKELKIKGVQFQLNQPTG